MFLLQWGGLGEFKDKPSSSKPYGGLNSISLVKILSSQIKLLFVIGETSGAKQVPLPSEILQCQKYERGISWSQETGRQSACCMKKNRQFSKECHQLYTLSRDR